MPNRRSTPKFTGPTHTAIITHQTLQKLEKARTLLIQIYRVDGAIANARAIQLADDNELIDVIVDEALTAMRYPKQ